MVCSSENKMNKRLQSNNSSGHRGVSYNKQYGKWEAEISAYNSKVRLGYFDDINEAIHIREQAEEKYFGEYNYKGGGVSYEEH